MPESVSESILEKTLRMYPAWDDNEPRRMALSLLTTALVGSDYGLAYAVLDSAYSYLNGNERREVRGTTYQFFNLCPTLLHERDAEGVMTCECRVLECRHGDDLDREGCEACNRCMECCMADDKCFPCESCNERSSHVDQCPRCKECNSCCNGNGECAPCEACGHVVHVDDWCGDCQRCTSRGCCECRWCSHCESNIIGGSGFCNPCNRCADCCECYFCEACGDRYDEICGNCSRCEECCLGEEACTFCGPIPKRKHELIFHSSSRKQFTRNPLRRHISVEIEVDTIRGDSDPSRLLEAANKWNDSIVYDGSLEGYAALEINTMPSNGDLFLEHIEDVCEGYRVLRGKASSSCGLHVHVDARDIAAYELRKVLILYNKVERALFELCDVNRLNGRYSQVCGPGYLNPSAVPKDFKRQILGSVYRDGRLFPEKGVNNIMPLDYTGVGKSRMLAAKKQKYSETRYRALNVHSYFHRGSLEFRHHEGTVDYSEITKWAMVCCNVIEASRRMSTAQLEALPKDSHDALLAILPESLHCYC